MLLFQCCECKGVHCYYCSAASARKCPSGQKEYDAVTLAFSFRSGRFSVTCILKAGNASCFPSFADHTQWEHPLDDYHKNLFKKLKAEKQGGNMKANSSAKAQAKKNNHETDRKKRSMDGGEKEKDEKKKGEGVNLPAVVAGEAAERDKAEKEQ